MTPSPGEPVMWLIERAPGFAVMLNCVPKKLCASPNSWWLWMWLYLVRGNQVEMKSYWIRVDPKCSDWCPYKGRFGDKLMGRNHGGRGCSDVSTSQGTPRNTKEIPGATRSQARKRFSLQPSEGTQPCQPLDIRLLVFWTMMIKWLF